MIGQGRGERLTPIITDGPLHWAIAVNPLGLSTPEVYGECDRLRGQSPVPPPTIDERVFSALRSGDATALAGWLRNDLQDAALSLRPELAEVIGEGMRLGALGGLVSGSGPTVVFLAEGSTEAKSIAAGLQAGTGAAQGVWAAGPAPGARVE